MRVHFCATIGLSNRFISGPRIWSWQYRHRGLLDINVLNQAIRTRVVLPWLFPLLGQPRGKIKRE